MTPLEDAINALIFAKDDETDPRRKVKVQNCLNELQAMHPNPHRDRDKTIMAKYTQDWKSRVGKGL